jgi:cobalt-zinc-cadmium efflux system protein
MPLSHNHASEGNLKVAFFLNLGFTLLEIAGGLWTNSIAVLTDAVHDAGDTASLGLAWYFEKLSGHGHTARHTYGFRRYRLLGGLVTGGFLVAGLGFVLWHSVGRLLDPEPVNAHGMIALAIVGVVFNGAAVLRVRRGHSLTEKIVSWHLLEDVLGWLAVLIGAGLMALFDLPIIDPVLSISIAVFVLWNVARNLREVARVFLQLTPESFDLKDFETSVKEIPGVVGIHHTHVWSLDGESHVFSTHVVMKSDTTRERIRAVKRRIREWLEPHEFSHLTIEIELSDEPCLCEEDASENGDGTT